jgi:hypothetical protein
MTIQHMAVLSTQQRRIKDLEAELNRYKYSHLGVLSQAAIRDAVANLSGAWDIICLDIRKMHELNSVLTWNGANLHLIAPLVQTRQADGRAVDVSGQLGGDEILFAVPAGDGRGFVRRLLSTAQTLTDALSATQREDLVAQTGGLVDGLCVALVCVEGVSGDYLAAAEKGLDLANAMKSGAVTGERATSGVKGTIVRFIGHSALRVMDVVAR